MLISKMRWIGFLLAGVCAVPTCSAWAQKDGLAATPPMGWNSWNHFKDKVDDASVRAAAEAMVSSGMRDAGYVYVNIDDTWEGERDAQGQDPGEQQVSGYEGACGLRAQQGTEAGDLFFARGEDLREV